MTASVVVVRVTCILHLNVYILSMPTTSPTTKSTIANSFSFTDLVQWQEVIEYHIIIIYFVWSICTNVKFKYFIVAILAISHSDIVCAAADWDGDFCINLVSAPPKIKWKRANDREIEMIFAIQGIQSQNAY